MSRSSVSKASNASSRMLQEIANRSQSKIYRVEGTHNDEEMRVIWNSLGLYVSRNLRMGRGVNVPRLGIFTFTPPEVRLKGVTNELERDQQPRTPVFLIQKDFVKGLNLRTAIFFHQDFGAGLRPYSAMGATGEIPIAKMNLIEIASYANMSKDAVELGLTRIIKYLSEKLSAGEAVSLEIPNLGQLVSRNGLVAVRFNEYIQRDTRNVLAKSVDERKMRGNMSLTSDNLRKFSNLAQLTSKLSGKTQQFFEIDDNAKRYLQSHFDLHVDESNLKRSITNFDRTVATKGFDRSNRVLKDGNASRMTQSGFFPNRTASKEFNMALRIVREWVRENGLDSGQAYERVCALAGKSSGVLNENELWNACKQISIDITQQQSQELFRILDNNRDGLITIDDWRRSINFDSNPKFRELQQYLRGKRYSITQILSILNLEGVRKTTVFTLKTGLIKLWPSLNEEDALLLAKHISKGKEEVEIEKIADSLNLRQDAPVEADEEWRQRFFGRIQRKMREQTVTEQQLTSKFRFYDREDSGYIEQGDFKTVLGELGVSVTLNELLKLVKFVPLGAQNRLDYNYIVEQLSSTDPEPTSELTQSQFRRIVRPLLSGSSIPLPISVSKLTSLLQSRHFKRHSEQQLLPFVRELDLNQDESITEEDVRGYRELIREKGKLLCGVAVEELLIRLREKAVRKKISYFDLFRRLDKVNSGFITREGWMKNVDEVLQYTSEEKESIFAYLDRAGTGVVDYKTFLAVMNGGNSAPQGEKFDWAESALSRLKQWFSSSHLTTSDGFKLLDSDGDSYISEQDLHKFLTSKLKYQQRQLGMVRVQKLMKLMDCYKHGRISYLDWTRLISDEKSWLKDAQQQIGIVLSKHYGSLGEAFTTITQGDKKMLFSAFERWVQSQHVLSGFMAGEDTLKYLFSQLDRHKKGFLLENDFVGLFASFDWKAEHLREFVHTLKLKFTSCEEAFRFMSDYGRRKVDFGRFKQVVGELFGSRFQESDCRNIWTTLAGGRETLEQSAFQKSFGDVWPAQDDSVEKEFKKDSWQYQDFSIIKGTTTRSVEHEYQERQKMEAQCSKFIDNLREIVASSPKTLEQAFSEVDSERTGRITNLAFKKAFRLLNIALTSKEIDLLLNYCEFRAETLIDWRQFIKQLSLQEDKLKLRARLQPKLQHISDLLHYYMISPKDAFRKWNNPRSGYLTFEEFHKMLKELYAQASQPLPEFQQISDLFTFIDIRNDKQLDFQEFTQVFRSCSPPNLLMGTTPAPPSLLHARRPASHDPTPVREQPIPLFRHSPAYEQFVQLIGRNRRYLQEELQRSNTAGTAFIEFGVVEKIMRGFVEKHKMAISGEMIRNLIAFAMTGEKVDYQLLVSRFKDMSVEISEFPRRKVF